MDGFVVQRYIMIQSGVNGSCPKAERNGGQAQSGHVVRLGKTKQSGGSQGSTKSSDSGSFEAADDACGKQAGDDSAAGDDAGHEAGIGYGEVKFLVYGRPCGAEQRVGDAEADEGDVDDD